MNLASQIPPLALFPSRAFWFLNYPWQCSGFTLSPGQPHVRQAPSHCSFTRAASLLSCMDLSWSHGIVLCFMGRILVTIHCLQLPQTLDLASWTSFLFTWQGCAWLLGYFGVGTALCEATNVPFLPFTLQQSHDSEHPQPLLVRGFLS